MMPFLRAALPGLLVVAPTAAAIALLGDDALATLTGRYALVVFVVGALMAALFHRSRVVVALLALGFLDGAFLGGEGFELFLPLGTVVVGLLGLLALTRDCGVRSRAGLLQLGVGAAVLALATILLRDPVALAAFSEVRLLPGDVATRARVPDATLVKGAVALLLGLFAVFRWRGPVEVAFVWSEVLVLAAIHPWASPSRAGLLLMAAGLVLAVSVLEQSYFMAYRDELTRLPARRALMRDLVEAGGVYTVAMVDVDHFKGFNDTYGHDVGDQVLQLVATRLAASGEGRAYRYGGEEFTLLFPGLTRDEALGPADRVRRAVEEATFSLRSWKRPRKRPSAAKGQKRKKKQRPRTLSVTVSIGLADSSAGNGSPDVVLKQADRALYRAKEEGRNRVSA
jgi:diguanylate cyclase (GGDEF)-like protein